MTDSLRQQRWMRLLLTCCAAGLLASAGCTKSAPSGTVSGKLLLDGKPVPAGCTVAFVSEKATASGTVDANGTYKLLDAGKPNIAAVTYKVSVAPLSEQMSQADYEKLMSGGGAAKPPAPTVEIPAKFQNPMTSGLSYTVKEGPQTIDIDLK